MKIRAISQCAVEVPYYEVKNVIRPTEETFVMNQSADLFTKNN